MLEFPAIRERIAAAAATDRGAELAHELTPSPDPREVARRQALTAEAIALLDEAAEPPLDGIRDVREPASHAALGGSLAATPLRHVADTISGALRVRAALEEQDVPLLHGLAAEIEPSLRPVAQAIDRAVEPDGSDLRDNASPALRKLRGELRTGRQRVADKLEQLVRRSGIREHLQEDFVTQRAGRPVLAVRASSRSSVPGIVHDSSDSGQTLFVEPFEVVELSNRQSEAAGAEREEAERILRELSAAVGEQADAVAAAVEATGRIDLALAVGAVSRSWRGAPVEVSADVRLISARHPLLDATTAVPIDLDLGSLRALVISGPNTGGKTVALKTLGLAALLHQSGLRPPAELAELPVFDAVLADIGDRQSIEMSLSTFSGHVASIVAILRAAGERSLVLLDELTSGHRSRRGVGAGAGARRPAGRAGAADGGDDALPGAEGVGERDRRRRQRGDRLRPGDACAALPHRTRPARHLARASDRGAARPRRRHRGRRPRAGRAGAAADPGAARRGRGGRASRRGRARSRPQAERAEAARSAERAREREAELEAEIAAVKASAAAERERAAAEAYQDLAAARAELEALREEIRVARRRDRESRRSAPAARERDRRLGAASERAEQAERAIRAFDEPLPLTGPLAAGDPVEAPTLGVHGTIAAIEGDEAEVVGPAGHRLRVPLSRLRPSARREPQPDEAETPVRVLAAARGDVSDELDVRGQRAQEAREAVRSFVDDAALAGLPSVRVVHGRGTGAVRAAVREELDGHPLVERRESDSADGATVAHLAG